MFVEAAIVEIPKGLAIPTEALITENNKNFVLLFKEEKITLTLKVAVKIGENQRSMLKLFQVTKLTLARKF
jgi:cobalt-zinc-cadmium efflux system membrane fusion protein